MSSLATAQVGGQSGLHEVLFMKKEKGKKEGKANEGKEERKRASCRQALALSMAFQVPQHGFLGLYAFKELLMQYQPA